MESKKIKETIRMVLDLRSMDGPVTRRGIAEEALRLSDQFNWSAADEYAARLAFMQTAVTREMSETHSSDFVQRHFCHLPEEFRDTLRKVPSFICISSGGGRESQHVRTVLATPEQWAANFSLKDHIVQATTASRNESRDIKLLIESQGVSCLADLMLKDAAE